MTAEPVAVGTAHTRRRPLAPLRDVGTGVAAVMTKELRGRMRGRRAFVILTIHLLLLAGFTWMMEALQERTTGAGFGSAFFASAQIGRELFIAILMLQTLIVLVLAPASTAGSISLEREKQTLDLLATTPISSLAIVLGKLVSALTWVFMLILASIPITALVFTFGGVGPEDVVRGYLVLVLTAIGFGSIGLFFSALVKRTQAATVLNFVTMLGVTGGATFVFVFWSVMTGWQVQPGFGRDESLLESLQRRPPEVLLYLNPFVAQVDVICGTETGFGTYCGIIGAVTDRQLVALDQPVQGGIGPVEPQQFGVQRDSYWPRSAVAWAIVSVVLIVLSVQLVTPTRRWRLRLPRARRHATGSPG